jgi:hypothetical protein
MTSKQSFRDFPDDEDRNGPRNFGWLAMQPPDEALVREYFIEFSRRESFKLHCLQL